MRECLYDSLIRRTYEDLEAEDLEVLRDDMADDVVWHVPGRSVVSGVYTGPEAILALLGRLKEMSEGTYRVEVIDIVPDPPDKAIVFERETATRNGDELAVIAKLEFEIHGEKITEVTVNQSDEFLFDEFWE